MKTAPSVRFAVLSLAVWLVSCASSSPQTRIAKNPDLFRALTPVQQELVQQGRLAKGLPKSGVFLAWGNPDRVAEWDRSGRRIERWSYVGVRPVYYHTMGVSVGWSQCGGFYAPYDDPYWFGGPTVEWVPYPASRVTFEGDVVSDWEARISRPQSQYFRAVR